MHAHKLAAPWVLSFGCYRRKNVYLLNVWRPIVPVLFCWPNLGLCRRVCMHCFYKRSKFQLNQMRNRRVIRGQNIRHSIPTLDCKFEPNLTFTDRDETGARRKVWTKDSLGPSAQKILSPHFRVMAPEIDICQRLTPNNFLTRGPNFQAICVLYTMELGQC